jgi:transcriptional regulator with XRE-family HTH domain
VSLGETIRVLRERKKLQQRDLAIRLQVAQSTVCDWESGKTFPRHARLKDIARVLGTSITRLLAA